MIKCSFGKLLKQLFFISLISCFGLLVGSSVSALDRLGYVGNIGTTYGSFYNNDYELLVNGKGNLLTNYFGEGKRLLYLQNGTYFFWSSQNNSLPYISVSAYDGQTQYRNQGYVLYYFLCDPITPGDFILSNCVQHSINDGDFFGSASRLLNSLNNSGYFYYNYYDFLNRSSSSPKYGGLDICFTSSQYNKSLCFYGGLDFSQQYCDSYYDNVLGRLFKSSGSWCNSIKSLTGSLNLGYTFGSINQSLLNFSPAGGGSIMDGSSSVDTSNNITGDYTYTTCTYDELLNYIESVGYNRNWCYGGLNDFDLYNSNTVYNPIPGTGKTLMQIVNYSNAWGTPTEWFNFWKGLYGNSNYNSMWESYPAVFHTWFDLFYSYDGYYNDFNTIYEYCKLLRSSQLDGVSNIYKGTYFSQTCKFIKQNQSSVGSGEVLLGVNWDGVGNMGKNTKTDPVEAIQDFFNRLKSTITTDYFGLGFLPQYIIGFLLAIILFRFIGH